MNKLPSLGLRIPQNTKDALEKAAKKDLRSVSSMAEKIITDWLQEKGFLPREEQ